MTDEERDVRNEAHDVFVGGDLNQIGRVERQVNNYYYLTPRPPTPMQLPSPPRQFVNRALEVGKIDELAASRDGDGTPVVVLTGTHGVGKTATSRHWANANGGRFTDGQLYVDFGELRHQGGVEVSDVLGGLLRAIGLPDEMIPVGFAERTALFRSSTAGKRILILLDDVDYATQVRPLIPNTSGGMVLVTSKSPLEELIHDGADLVRLAPLDSHSAEAILASMIGSERAAADPVAVEELAVICAGLPVALRVCGARLVSDPGRGVASLVAELSDETQRLERIVLAPGRSFDAVFTDAYRALSATAAEVYRRLGVHPGPSFTAPLAAAAAAIPIEQARESLGELRAAQLIEDSGTAMRFHDLLRIHARSTAEREDDEADRELALRRTIDFYVVAAQRMDRAIIPERLRLAELVASELSEPAFGSPEEAFRWFGAERPNLLAALRAAADREWDAPVWQLGEALWLAYHNQKHFGEALEVYDLAARSARRLGDVSAEARLRTQLVRALMDLEDYARAESEMDLARELADRSGDLRLCASVMEFRGVLDIALGRYADAIAALEQGRALSRELGSSRGVALQEYHLGRALHMAGERERAIDCFRHAVGLIDHELDGLTVARILIAEGSTYEALGEIVPATTALEEALEITLRHRIPFYEATVRERLASLASKLGQTAVAREHLERALAVYVTLGSPRTDDIRERLGATLGESP